MRSVRCFGYKKIRKSKNIVPVAALRLIVLKRNFIVKSEKQLNRIRAAAKMLILSKKSAKR